MSNPLIIVGAGGFGREAVDVVRAQASSQSSPAYDFLGVVDSFPSPDNLRLLKALNVPYLGSEQEWIQAGRFAFFIVGIGDPAVRLAVSERFERQGHIAATAIHPTATVGSLASMAPGVVICAGAQISTNVRLGRHVHLNANVTIGHDTVLREFVSINPGATISGNVECQPQVLVGAGSVVLQGLTIGSGSIVGAAACVTKNVPANRVAVGLPARWEP